MAKPSLTTNRRDLLIGASAFAVTGGASALPGSPPLSAIGPAMDALASPAGEAPGLDPAYVLYVRATAAEGRVNAFSGRNAGEHDALYDAYIAAQLKLAATPSTSLMGVRGKMKRLAADRFWEPDDSWLESCLGLSVLADLWRMIAATPPGWPGQAPNLGRRS